MNSAGKEYPSQRAEELHGPWRFQIDAEDLGEREGWFSEGYDTTHWAEVTVPGAWDLYDQAMWSYEGVGWYATEIPADLDQRGKWQRLLFNRVSIHAKVWLNGQFLGEHLGGYLPFEFDVSAHLRPDRSNLLVLRVDNARRQEWLPAGTKVEWVQYGGILQPVLLLTTNPAYVSDFRIVAVPTGPGAEVTCAVEVTNGSADRLGGRVHVSIPWGDSSIAGSSQVRCEPQGKSTALISLPMSQAATWSPESPVLYEASASLEAAGETLDQVTDRFGVRTIEVRGPHILLNGKPLQIKGVNRYDEYAGFGPTVPEDVVREDLMCIKRSGANLIRVHYPQDPTVLKIMDEIGLLLMEEVPLNWWGVDWFRVAPDTDSEAVINAAERALEDMVRRDRNHPCLIIWSMANECATETEVGIRAMRQLMRRARELDKTRLVTFVADGDVRQDLAFDEADIVCANLYYGVFNPEGKAYHIADMDALVRAPTEAHLRQTREHFGDKPIVVTEFGARSIYGLRGDVQYTEDHHAAYLEAVWQAILNAPDISGGVVWSWADYYHQRDFVGFTSPMAHGPFGVVTVDRKPKQALLALARMYGGQV